MDPVDYTVTCRCGWIGKRSTLVNKDTIRVACPECRRQDGLRDGPNARAEAEAHRRIVADLAGSGKHFPVVDLKRDVR